MKKIVLSPANIAFIKHWGMSLDGMPLAASLSMNLSNCYTTTEIEENTASDSDRVALIDFKGKRHEVVPNLDNRTDKIFNQIDLIRNLAKSNKRVKINTCNSFPTKAGIASSASGFSALTFALIEFFELKLDLNQIANLTAKAGSISAVRSLCDNFGAVKIKSNSELEIEQFNEFESLELVDIVVIVSDSEKNTSSFDGQRVAESSPLFYARLDAVKRNFKEIVSAAKIKNIEEVGRLIELESNMLHAVMMTSNPAQNYMNSLTFKVIDLVFELRKQGINVYYTVDAGCNVHLITSKINLEVVTSTLNSISGVLNIISNFPCKGTRLISLSELNEINCN